MKQFSKEKRDIHWRRATRMLLLVSFLAFIFFQAGSLNVASAAGFDAWQSGFVVNTDYTAATDGFVVVRVGGGGNVTCDTDLQTEGVSRQYATANNDGSQQSMMMPVRKGGSWRVWSIKKEYNIGGDCPRNIYWIPVSTGLFGAWQSGFGVNTNYTAPTDGFVVARIGGSYIDVDCTVDIQTEGVSRQWANPNDDGAQPSMMMPVRKGASWRVGDTNPGACPPEVYWMPAVTDFLDAWQSGFGVNTTHTATTNGFVVARVGGAGDVTCTTDLQTAGVSRQWGNANHDGAQQSMMMPVRQGDSWLVGSIGGCARNVYWIPFSAPVLPALTLGTIIEKATKDGVAWDSPPFAEVYDAPYGANQTATIDAPVTFTNMQTGVYRVTSVTPPAGVILQNINGSPLPYSATLAPGGTITVTYNFVTIPGTIKVLATKDGVAWDSPPFAEVYDAPYGANQTATIDAPVTFTNMQTGTYTVKSVTPPAGVILQNVNGSSLPYSATLSANGTITVTYNFVTPPPTTGTLQFRATKDGVAWDSPAFPVNMLLPNGSVGDMSVNPPQDIANSPLGAYRINGVTPPAGVTFQNVNGSSLPYSQNLAGGSTIIFTFNFTTTVVVVPTLVVTPISASVGINGAQQFNAIYDPDGSGPQFSSTVTNLSGWASSNNSVATASSVGVATGVSAGSATITASYAGLTASASLTVTAPTPTLDVTPSSAIVEIGDTKQFNAMYDPDGPSGPQSVQDVTATAVWSSVDTAKVTVSSGLAVRVGHGLTNVRAVYVGLSDSAAVLDPATLRVDPRLAELVSEQTVQLKAFYDSDGSTGSDPETEVTQLTDWSSRNPAVASVDNASAKGLVTAGSVSRTQTSDIFAGYSGLSDAARITVLAAQVPTVTLSASPSSVNSGGSSSLTWSVANANSCSASGGWSGAKSPSGGSESIGSLTVATTFTLTCSNANGSSSASAAVSIVASPVPQAPSNLRVVSSSLNSCGTIGLAWRDNSDSETRFEMERNSGSGFVKIAEPAQNTTNFVDTTIRQNTSYSYRVRACNSFGCSAYSNTATGNNQSPAADFTFAPANPQVNQPVLFTDMSEYFGIVASRQWTFEDGNPALVTVSGATTTAKFIDAEPEEKTVILRAADTVGRICTIAKKVPVKLGSTPPDWEEEPPE